MTSSSEIPKKLGPASSFAVVSPDKLSVKYYGVGAYYVGAVQAEKPAPVNRTTAYYFEMRVKNGGANGFIAIGFTKAGYDLTRHPGWEANSVGYHGDNGMFYINGVKTIPPTTTFRKTFTKNDVVGAGIDYVSKEFFFTKNGRIVGTIFKDFDGSVFPTVAVHSKDEEVEVNFGQKPFAYDHPEILKEKLKKLEKTLEEKEKEVVDLKSKALEEKEKEVADLRSSNVASEEKWKKLLEERLDKLMEKSELLLKKPALKEEEEGKECVGGRHCCGLEKVIEEKDKELASFKNAFMELLN